MISFSPDFIYWQNNNSTKEGANQKAEFTAMNEAAKSKMHQVTALFTKFCIFYTSLLHVDVDYLFFSVVQGESLHSDEVIQGL